MSARRNLTAARLREVPTDAHEHTHQTICAWCSRSFAPRRTGGRPQRFCSERCRRANEKAMREWAQGELAAGRVTIAEIKRERSSEPVVAISRPDRSGHQTSCARCPRGIRQRISFGSCHALAVTADAWVEGAPTIILSL